jgi:O-acetylserine/cysteine efflux transporter
VGAPLVTLDCEECARAGGGGLEAKDVVLLLLTQILWGGGLVLTKIGVDAMPPLLFMAIRLFVVSALLAPLLRWHSGQMGMVALIALLTGSLNFGLTATGMAMTDDIPPVAIAVQLYVSFSTLFSVIFLRERLGPWRILALIIAFGGVLVIGFDPAVFRQGPALLLVVAAALAMAAGTIMMRQMRNFPVYEMQAWLSLFSWPPLLLASLVLDGSPLGPILDMSWPLVVAIAWMALGAGLIGRQPITGPCSVTRWA